MADAQARAQLALIDRELAMMQDQEKSDRAHAEELRASLAKTPQVEMALSAYERRYANLQTRYDNAVKKLAEAEIGQRLEVNRQAERFEVIEQAQMPTEPVSPNRLLIAGGGMVASLGLGLALALGLELLNPAIRTSSDLQRRLQLHPVVAVPYIRTRGERRRIAIKWAIRIALVVGGLAAFLWAVDQYVMPLPVLWSKLLARAALRASSEWSRSGSHENAIQQAGGRAMVERLKIAIEKARASRAGVEGAPPPWQVADARAIRRRSAGPGSG